MIISASRRTDIPRFHSDWLVNRVEEGFVDVRNPMVPTQVSRYSLDPSVVDGIVFWTKDPSPMLDKLDRFAPYPYYFQFTLTPYDRSIEAGVQDKRELIDVFKRLSDKIGSDRVNWRFDPILINDEYSVERQSEAFDSMARELKGFTNNATISFIDEYNFNGRSAYASVHTEGVSPEQQNELARAIAESARANGMTVDTCAEAIDLDRYGIGHARCVDARVFERIGDCKLSRLKTRYEELAKDKAQRKECLCMESIDIGWPNTCLNGCRYCYATRCPERLPEDMRLCDPNSTLLYGAVDLSVDTVTDHRGTGDAKDRSFRFVDGCTQTALPL